MPCSRLPVTHTQPTEIDLLTIDASLNLLSEPTHDAPVAHVTGLRFDVLEQPTDEAEVDSAGGAPQGIIVVRIIRVRVRLVVVERGVHDVVIADAGGASTGFQVDEDAGMGGESAVAAVALDVTGIVDLLVL